MPHPLDAGIAGILLFGLLLGLKHALDADHLVAVASLVSERFDVRRAVRIGAMWGAGHTLSILVVGGAIILFRPEIPEPVTLGLEFLVGVMIVFLGARLVIRGVRQKGTLRIGRHSHGIVEHAHPHLHIPSTGEAHTLHAGTGAGTPFLVGMMHGLAGSASLALLVLTGISSVPLSLFYLAVFGLGSIAGMATMSAAVALPVAVAAQRFGGVDRGVRLVAGVAGVAFGAAMLYEIGIGEGLLAALFG